MRDNPKNINIFYITNNGFRLAQGLGTLYPDAQIISFKAGLIPSLWDCCHAFIFIMATGIVVRTIAPMIQNKKIDPAVIVLDKKGERCKVDSISILKWGINCVFRWS